MKKYTLLILSVFLTSSCIPFLWNDDEALSEWEEAATKTFQSENVEMLIPSNWQEIWESNLPVPKSGDILLALKSTDKSDNLYRTLVILEDTLLWNISSEQYARNDYQISIKKYSWFRELAQKSIQYQDGINSKLYIFEAKYNPDSPRMKFIQSSKICKDENTNYVYNLTIALPSSATDLDKYEWLIKTLQCKKQEA